MTPGLGESISGVILFDETIRQKTSDGIPCRAAHKAGHHSGSRWTEEPRPLPICRRKIRRTGWPSERLIEYRGLGARFTKWRAVIAIGEQTPTRTCLEANAQALALFAGLSQEAGWFRLSNQKS